MGIYAVWHNIDMAHTSRSEQYDLHVGERGRLVLPSLVRKQLALREGDLLVLTVEPNGHMVLMPLRDQVHKARGLMRDVAPGVDLAGELVRERREEATKEGRSR